MLHIAFVGDTEFSRCWPAPAAVIRRLRAEGRCDLLLHAGDVRLARPTSGAAVAIMNRLKFDAVAIGNHDIDMGREEFAASAAGLRARHVCANVAEPPEGGIAAVARARRAGVRIAIVGVSGRWPLDGAIRGSAIEFTDPVEAAGRTVASVRQAADLVVVLSHAGLATDVEIARANPGIDLIVGGHTHDLLAEPLVVDGVPIVHAGARGSHVGWVEVAPGFVRGGVIETADETPDAWAVRAVADARGPAGDEVIGHSATDLRAGTSEPESAFANLMADLMRERSGAEVALLRRALVYPLLPAGPILRRDLDTLLGEDEDRLVVVEMSGAELESVIDASAASHYLLVTPSGARYAADPLAPEGSRVRSLEVGGVPIDRARTYTVAAFEFPVRTGHAAFRILAGRPYKVENVLFQRLLQDHLRSTPVIAPVVDGRMVLTSAPKRGPKPAAP